jgi:putative MATE family efflux protein
MQENKMGVMPEGKLLLSMSLPVMGSMLISALYNIVDSMFVARISDNALNAVSLSFPIQLLMISLATGIGVGLNVLLSHALGAGQQQRADSIATNSIFLSFVCWIAFAILGQLFSAPFLSLFTENKVVLSMGLDYLRICTGFSGGVFLLFTAERLMQATGKTVYHMLIQCLGAGLNIILDPIFIFGYWGCPAFGVAGAAAATVIGQCVAAAVGLWLNHLLNHDIHLSFRGFRPGRAINLEICRVGLPAALIQALSTFMVAGMNAVLMPLHAAAVGFFGVYYKLQNFLYMPLYGMTNTLVPIIGYNLGAGKPNRIRRLAWQAVKFSLVLMGAGMVLFLLFTRALLGLFGSEAFAYSGGLAAIRIIAPSFLPAGVILTFAGMLQGLGRSGEALLLSSLRQIIFLLPVAYLLGQHNLSVLWIAFPVAELLSLPASLWLWRRAAKALQK